MDQWAALAAEEILSSPQFEQLRTLWRDHASRSGLLRSTVARLEEEFPPLETRDIDFCLSGEYLESAHMLAARAGGLRQRPAACFAFYYAAESGISQIGEPGADGKPREIAKALADRAILFAVSARLGCEPVGIRKFSSPSDTHSLWCAWDRLLRSVFPESPAIWGGALPR